MAVYVLIVLCLYTLIGVKKIVSSNPKEIPEGFVKIVVGTLAIVFQSMSL